VTILYFDCFSGASGDMILGALVDAGAPLDAIRQAVDGLPIEDITITTRAEMRGGIRSTAVDVDVADDAAHRHYRDIVRMIDAARLSPRVRERALATFEVLAVAEGRIHGIDPADVHFHEVGALDAIADVVGAAVVLEHFAPGSIHCSSIPMGSGTVEAAHGTIPVPAPAVTEILRDVPIRAGGDGETITPTGAAILKAACESFGEVPAMTLRTTGYGAGSRPDTGGVPNVLRVLIGDPTDTTAAGHIVLETNIDDMSPELVPYVIEALLRAGAQDAWSSPILMKKSRPAFMLSALVETGARDAVIDALYRETTTLGVRARPVDKDELLREWIEIDIEGHSVRVKIGRRASEVVTVSPEYEDCVRAARATGMPLKEIYERARRAATRSLKL